MQPWRVLIGPDTAGIAWWQVCDRTVVVFFVGVALIRLSGRRTFSRESPLEIVVAIVIGSNLSRALTGNAAFLPTLAGSALLVALHRLIAHACLGSAVLTAIFKGRATPVIRDGQPDAGVLRREAIAEDDLREALRSKGVDEPGEVRLAMLERSGQISVVKK